jgi:seryl-tRNA synthetase
MGSPLDFEQIAKLFDDRIGRLQENFDAKLNEQQSSFEKMLKDEFGRSLDPVKKKVDVLESKVTEIENKLSELDDISSRVRNLLLNMIPFREGENLNVIFRTLATKLGFESPPNAMVRRFKGPDDDKRTILISFDTEMSKSDFLHRFKVKAADMKRSIFREFPDDQTRIYLQHDFTSIQYQLHKAAMKHFKEKSINKIVVRTGNKIMIQISDNEKFLFFPDATALNAEIERRNSSKKPAIKSPPKTR